MLGRCSKLPFQAILAVIFEHFCQLYRFGKAPPSPTELIADCLIIPARRLQFRSQSLSLLKLRLSLVALMWDCKPWLVGLVRSRCFRHFFPPSFFGFCTFLLFGFFAFRPVLLQLVFGLQRRAR